MRQIRFMTQFTLQLAGLCTLLWLCNALTAALGWHFPGSVIGLFIVLGLLLLKLLPEQSLMIGSHWLLSELLLFFIPPVLSILKYQILIMEDGWQMVITIVCGTVMVMVGTAWVVDKVFAWEHQLKRQVSTLALGEQHE